MHVCARVICLQYTKKSDLHAGTLASCMSAGVVCKYSTFRLHGCVCSCVAFWPFYRTEDGLWRFSVMTHHSSRCLSHPSHFCFCLWQILLNCFIFCLTFLFPSAAKILSFLPDCAKQLTSKCACSAVRSQVYIRVWHTRGWGRGYNAYTWTGLILCDHVKLSTDLITFNYVYQHICPCNYMSSSHLFGPVLHDLIKQSN